MVFSNTVLWDLIDWFIESLITLKDILQDQLLRDSLENDSNLPNHTS